MFKQIALILSSTFCTLSFAQNFNTSPFSSHGIGDLNNTYHPAFSGHGNASVGLADSLNVNYYNPASYAYLGKGQPLFSFGINHIELKTTEQATNYDSRYSNIGHFAMAIPMGKWGGLAFGLKPFSTVGYSIIEGVKIGEDSLYYRFKGNGSINEAFTGLSISPIHTDKQKLTLGINLSYLFGTIKNEKFSYLAGENEAGYQLQSYRFKSLFYQAGLMYQLQFKNRHFINIGASYTPEQELTASKTTDLYYMLDYENMNSISDTITAFYQNNSISFPSSLSAGFSYTFRPKADSSYNKVQIYQLTFTGAFTSQNWEDYRANFNNESASTFLNTQAISFGMEFLPHYNFLDRSKAIKYFSRMKYRAGAQFSTLPLHVNNVQYEQQMYTFGLGFPLLNQRSASSIQVSFHTGKRGLSSGNAIAESFYGFNVGIVIAPGLYDRWFRKFKID